MGFGDDLMALGEARKLAKKKHSVICIGSDEKLVKSELFDKNPIISNKKVPNQIYHYPGNRPYIDYEHTTKDKMKFKKYTPVPGDIIFSIDELSFAFESVKQHFPFIFIEPNIKKLVSGNNKDWGRDNWQELVDKLVADGFTVLQANHRFTTCELSGVEQISVKSFRQTCAIAFFASLLITHEGGMHHAAAAMRKHAIVIFGGFITPEITGYKGHENLYVEDAKTPCGNLEDCEHCRTCMDKIRPDEVRKKISYLLKLKIFFLKVIPKLLVIRYFRFINYRREKVLKKLLV